MGSLLVPWLSRGGKTCLSCHRLCFLTSAEQLKCVLLVNYISIILFKGNKLCNALTLSLENGSKHVLLMVGCLKDMF